MKKLSPNRPTSLLLAALLLGGCAAGPDYHRPTLELPRSYGEAVVAGDPMFDRALAIRNEWWTAYRSSELNELIGRALRVNGSIEAADAALQAARENVAAQQGMFLPTVGASYSPSRTKLAGNLGGNSPGVQGNGSVISTTQNSPADDGGTAPFNAPVIYSFHTAQLNVAYTPDVFGANRRQLEVAQAQQQVASFQLEAAYITLATNIVAAALQDALLRRQIALNQEIIAAAGRAVVLAQRQRAAGHISGVELAAQEGTLAQAKQQLPPLQKQAAQNRNLLRTLAGLSIDGALPAFDLAAFELPAVFPLSLPSQLVDQRPDVRAAEAQLQAASAQVGIARAARLPQISLTANAGGAASQFGQMFWSSGKFFDLTANLAQPLFDGGALKHREHAAGQNLRGAVASYRTTVASAFQNVADVLQAIGQDTESMQVTHESAAAAQAALKLAKLQHERGFQDELGLIAAAQNQRQAQMVEAQARAALLGDSAGLFQALGGGWWNRTDRQ